MVAELCARSCYSLLHGASHPEELVHTAHELGLSHLALTDRDAVYGLPAAHVAAKQVGLPLLCGATVTVKDHGYAVLIAESRAGWGRMCRLITQGHAAAEKGRARVTVEALAGAAGGLTCLLPFGWTPDTAAPLREAFGSSLGVLVSRTLAPTDDVRLAHAHALAAALDAPWVASNDVLFHEPSRRRLADVLTAIRRRTTVMEAGRALHPNAERHLLHPDAFRARYGDLHGPDGRSAVQATVEVAERCAFRLSELRYTYPQEVVPEGWTPMGWLRHLTVEGAAERYPSGVPAAVQAQIDHELGVIEELDFPSYFLTVHDIVAEARRRGILCQGRGSAANSAVCYALGITAIDPARARLLFERFLSAERAEPPDIDVDFEHERREELLQYVYARYGRERAAMVNEIIAWRPRSAVRDVGRAFGLPPDQLDHLAQIFSRGASRAPDGERARVREVGLDPDALPVRRTLELARELVGMPRHIGIHSGGFVIADDRVIDLVPVEPATMEARTVVQWDKYGVEGLGFVKVDLLALGMLTAIRKAFDLIAGAYGTRWDLHTIPAEDPAVYAMFSAADTVGVFQIESRAQQSMLPRLRPRCFYDLVVEVALVRPGPIQGGMVHPYLRRRNGEEPVTYAHPSLVPVLERTLGVPLFQEQVMEIAVVAGGFSPGEADGLRRAMGAWRKRGGLDAWGDRLLNGMAERGIDPAFGRAIFEQIKGFAEYGFPESHAASFALLVYVSGWLKRHHPEAFCAALINSQPMGFYAPRTLVADAQRHGVRVRPIDVTVSVWDCTLEASDGPRAELRLGLRLVQGLGEADARQIADARAEAPFAHLADFAARTRLDRRALDALADAGALATLVAQRRHAAWTLQGLWTDLPLFAQVARQEPEAPLPAESDLDLLAADYRATGLSVSDHPGRALREACAADGRPVTPLAELSRAAPGSRVRLAGLVGSRQRPGTAKGVTFLSLEDDTGQANLIVWPKVWEANRRTLASSTLLGVEGRLQRQGGAYSVLVESAERLDDRLRVQAPSRDFH